MDFPPNLYPIMGDTWVISWVKEILITSNERKAIVCIEKFSVKVPQPLGVVAFNFVEKGVKKHTLPSRPHHDGDHYYYCR